MCSRNRIMDTHWYTDELRDLYCWIIKVPQSFISIRLVINHVFLKHQPEPPTKPTRITRQASCSEADFLADLADTWWKNLFGDLLVVALAMHLPGGWCVFVWPRTACKEKSPRWGLTRSGFMRFFGWDQQCARQKYDVFLFSHGYQCGSFLKQGYPKMDKNIFPIEMGSFFFKASSHIVIWKYL